uniref:DDE Tnp4 domain-containing protein n=1 Tax=Lactuca sativa TaxID=4236 RepID=A0A9R1VIG7_LACSA|nr:hypothetical protein LSAT_V11C500229500 [Lactuca sativa]
MNRNHFLLFVKLLESYIMLLICLATVRLWLIKCEEKEAQRRDLSESTLESRLDTISQWSTEIQCMLRESDENCINKLCMDINAFALTIEEQVAIFLNVLPHHKKNICIQIRFYRSGEMISCYVHRVLGALMHLQEILFVNPTPVAMIVQTIDGNGAIDGTYIEVNVLDSDKPRYRTRKGNIAMNVLGVCNRDMNFVYVLAGWEGSTTDSRCNYHLADGGYINGEGFLAPYRGIRTHMALDPEENMSSTFEDMPIREEQPNHFQIVDVVESRKVVGINITSKHVQNKIKRLKDIFFAAYNMQNTSGFGWDDTRKCVVVDSAEILEEYLQKHPNKNYIANKPFRAYERLANIFGKDRATCGMAESVADVTENQNVDNEEGERIPSSNYNP